MAKPGRPRKVDLAIEKDKAPVQEVDNRPWKPASLIDIPAKYKDSRFEYYAATTSRTGNIQKKISEGWEIDTKITPQMRAAGALPPTVHDGGQKDDTLRFRELLVMRMPKERVQKRREYFERLARESVEGEEARLDNALDGKGSRSYGDIKTRETGKLE